MAVSLNLARQTAAAAARGNAPQDDFVPAQFWANVGYWDEIDGEPIFISLTKGIPLDPAQLKAMRGNSELAKRKNRLGTMLQDAAMQLEPGQAEDVLELVVQIRHAAGEDENPAPIESKLTKLTFAKRG